VIMGRKTFESIGKALPNRRNLILSRSTEFIAEGCEVMQDLQAAVRSCSGEKEVFIIGGSEIYRQALPMADRLYLTRVDTVTDADAFFPSFSMTEWELIKEEEHHADTKNPFNHTFCIYQRKR